MQARRGSIPALSFAAALLGDGRQTRAPSPGDRPDRAAWFGSDQALPGFVEATPLNRGGVQVDEIDALGREAS